MKVKKNQLFVIVLIIFILSIGLMGTALYMIYNYDIDLNDGIQFARRGFSVNPATPDEIERYISEEQKNIDILHYNLSIELFPDKKKIECNAIITGIFKINDQKTILLNFNDGFDVSDISLNGKEIDYLYKNDKLKLLLTDAIIDTFKILVNYFGQPEGLGFGSFVFGENNNKSAVYTLNEPIFASTWFPCNDMPSDKVLTDIFITNDSRKTSLSNGKLIGIKDLGEKKTFHWKTLYPISTYLISIYSADYEYFSEQYISENLDTMSIDYYVFEEDLEKAKKDFSIHIDALKHFSYLFGEYAFIKEKYGVAQFLWKYGAMEHQTITGIGKDFVNGHQFFTNILVHELAHQWWGNAVTLKSWKDIWLNEGFATYSVALYWERESGFNSLKSTMREYLTDFDDLKLYDPEKMFSRIVYNKGAWVLHMLRREVGDESFFLLMRTYYERYKYGNASIEDFISLAQNVSGKKLKWFFDQWIYDGEGKIELDYSFSTLEKNENYEVTIELNQTQDGYECYKFIIDVDIVFEDGSIKRENLKIEDINYSKVFLYNKPIKNIELDPDFWLAAEFNQIN